MSSKPNLTTITLALATIIWLISPLYLSDYQVFVLNILQIHVLLAIGLNIVLGRARQFALASAAFYGVGAYTYALLQLKLGLSFVPALMAGGLVGGVTAALVSMSAWRVGGLYLAMVTFGFSEVFQFALIHSDAITKGPDGLAVPRPVVAGHVFADVDSLFWLFFPVVVVCVAFAAWIGRSSFGYALTALGDSEEALSAIGLTPRLYKTAAFGISGVYAGIAGGLICALVGFIDPYSFGLKETLLHLTMIAVGGFGSLAGAIVGAIFLTGVAQGLQKYHGVQEIVYGVVLLLVFIFCPNGLAGLPGQLSRRWGRRQ